MRAFCFSRRLGQSHTKSEGDSAPLSGGPYPERPMFACTLIFRTQEELEAFLNELRGKYGDEAVDVALVDEDELSDAEAQLVAEHLEALAAEEDERDNAGSKYRGKLH